MTENEDLNDMSPEQAEGIVQRDLAAFEGAQPAAGQTVGVPWSASKLQETIAALRASLVTPYREQFHLKGTGAQMRTSKPEIADHWVVAEAEPFLVFYDPVTREYGLALRGRDGTLPQTIGVRGDLVGVFAAM
jgi:hypothetical protein